MSRLGLLLCLILLLGLFLGLWWLFPLSDGEQSPFEPVEDKAHRPGLDWQECNERLPSGVQGRCAWYDTGVKTNAGEAIRLPLLLMWRDGESASGPLTVLLPGGPGAPGGTAPEPAWLWGAWMLGEAFPGRLLVFDPRGTGQAEPALGCPGREWQLAESTAQPLSATQEAVAQRDRLRECRAHLTARGMEPADFAAHHVLSDVPALLTAMAEEQARLIGLSHGSRFALALMRAHPDTFTAAVLDGVFPPNVDAFATQPDLQADAMQSLFDDCHAEPDCDGAALESAVGSLRSGLAAQPQRLHLAVGPMNMQVLWLTESRFLDLLFAAQVDDASLAALPHALLQAADGDYRALARLLEGVVQPAFDPDRKDAVYWASLCSETAPPNPDAIHQAARARGLAVTYPLAGLQAHPCLEGWGEPPLPATFRTPVTVEQPVLLLAPERDPVTPSAWARTQAERLPQGQLLPVKGRSHGVFFDEPCVAQAVIEFLNGPEQAALPSQC